LQFVGIAQELALAALEYALPAQSLDVPGNYREARESPDREHWDKAIQTEVNKLEDNETWVVVPRDGHRVLGSMWNFTRKTDVETGQPGEYKARFVVKGCQQRPGDYHETFAAVAHKTSHRVFLTLVNYLDLECDQTDVIGAFLKADIDRDIYVTPPGTSQRGIVCIFANPCTVSSRPRRCSTRRSILFYGRSSPPEKPIPASTTIIVTGCDT
jgi:hypothetical protein